MPMPTSRIAVAGASERRSSGTSSPVMMKTTPYRRKVIVSHTARPVRRASAPHDARAAAAEVQAGDHRRDHAGGAELLGREEGGVGRQEGDRDLHRRVLDARPDLRDHPPHRQADRPPAQHRDGEGRERPRTTERAPDRGRDGDSVDRQRGRVVQQALALEERHDPSRYGEPRDDGGRRDRVGRRDDRAERQRDGPWDAGDQRVRDHGHRSRASRRPGRSRGRRSCPGSLAGCAAA